MNMVLLLCAVNVCAMQQEGLTATSPDGTVIATIVNGKSIQISNAKTMAAIKTIACSGNSWFSSNSASFSSIKFLNNKTLSANVTDGIDPEHMHTKSVDYSVRD